MNWIQSFLPANMAFVHPALMSLLGGLLIGLAAWLLWATLHRTAGASGIAASALDEPSAELWRWVFLASLVVVGGVALFLFPLPTAVHRNPWLLVVSGALVGVGTVLANGCTSGHGICGLARRSLRSVVAVGVFMGAGMLTASVTFLFFR